MVKNNVSGKNIDWLTGMGRCFNVNECCCVLKH